MADVGKGPVNREADCTEVKVVEKNGQVLMKTTSRQKMYPKLSVAHQGQFFQDVRTARKEFLYKEFVPSKPIGHRERRAKFLIREIQI